MDALQFAEKEEAIKKNWQKLAESIGLKTEGSEKSYICPACGGLMQEAAERADVLHCQNCNYKGDIIDLYSYIKHTNINKSIIDLYNLIYYVPFTEEGKADPKADYIKAESAFGRVEAFIKQMQEAKGAISTGLASLNGALSGGLYDGLYILGGATSTGKTSFALQVADNIASTGTDALIFSLEMASSELIAKSVSRQSFRRSPKDAKTTRQILNGRQGEEEAIKEALEIYKQYAKHIYIFEGVGSIGVEQIKEKIKKHIVITGNIPVVFIDYLQILAPTDPKSNDKQNIDKAILELKRISRDLKAPIIAISSFNRESYKDKATITAAAFKESGAIEYGADVLAALDVDKGEVLEEVRSVKLKILKNRNGRSRAEVKLKFYAAYNIFLEVDEEAGGGYNWNWTE